MFSKNSHLVVAIKNSEMDALRVSVPPLRRFSRKFTLVIYNDNVNTKQIVKMVRQLGWRGKLRIINSEKNLGELESYIATIDFIRNSKINSDWIMFVNDQDVLLDASVPNVADNVFAIVQNATTINDSHVDIFKINPAWVRGTDCGKTGPHFEIDGTMVRAQTMFEFVDFLRPVLSQVKKMIRTEKCDISKIMWEMLNTAMRVRHPEMSPIYMDQTNYVAINLGATGARRANKNQTAVALARFRKLAELAATQNMVAENQ